MGNTTRDSFWRGVSGHINFTDNPELVRSFLAGDQPNPTLLQRYAEPVVELTVKWSEEMHALKKGNTVTIDETLYVIEGKEETWREGDSFPPPIRFTVTPFVTPS